MYAEIILPLPLYSTFTYSVPPEFENALEPGSRVLVQFGKKKYYTGLVRRLHSIEPKGYEVKPIVDVLDSKPVVRFPQLRLWEWIAEYYLCSPGDVFKAALPAGLKPESETYVTLNPDFDPPEGFRLNDRQLAVVDYLEKERKKATLSDIEKETALKGIAKTVNSLLEAGVIEIDEKVVEKYRPRREVFVELNLKRGDQDGLHDFFDKVRRSINQEKLLIAWLDRSGWLQSDTPLRPVRKQDLLSLPGASPGILKAMADKGIFNIVRHTVNRFNSVSSTSEVRLSPLSEAQGKALMEIHRSFQSHNVTLLHGVTGSGKTEVYTHLMAGVLDKGHQVLFLVPEISLTTQLTDRLRRVFGSRLLVYHSKFSDNERVDIWRRLLSSKEPMIVLGARSAVFLPFARLGLVIIDEEHEASFKQFDPAPRYNARDVATILASFHGAKVLLGSATPAIETYYKATTGKFGLVSLTERFDGSVLPEVEIVDMRDQRKKKLNSGILSSVLKTDMEVALEGGSQALLFQNRRGFAPVVICRRCGWTPKCENCDVSMVYHKHSGLLKCHYCGSAANLPSLCPACGSNDIATFGYGTERIAEEIHDLFPGRRVARMDLDTTRNKDSYQEIIEEFADHQTDILVGTQMISKGLDFDAVRVVGVISADTLLNFPDFRSNERAFNMLEQVAGRAGRRRDIGKVVIQSSQPDEPVLGFVARHDYGGFYESEILERRKYNYPPFSKVINIYLKNKNPEAVDRAALSFANRLRGVFGARVLGPEKPFVSKIALWYIQTIMLKIEAGASMKKVKQLLLSLYESCAALPEMRGTLIYYDVDPV